MMAPTMFTIFLLALSVNFSLTFHLEPALESVRSEIEKELGEKVEDAHHYETMVRNHLEKRGEMKRTRSETHLKPFPERLASNNELAKRFVFGNGNGKRSQTKQTTDNSMEKRFVFGNGNGKRTETKSSEMQEMEKRFVFGNGNGKRATRVGRIKHYETVKRNPIRERIDNTLDKRLESGKQTMEKKQELTANEDIAKRFVFGNQGKRSRKPQDSKDTIESLIADIREVYDSPR